MCEKETNNSTKNGKNNAYNWRKDCAGVRPRLGSNKSKHDSQIAVKRHFVRLNFALKLLTTEIKEWGNPG